MKFNDGERTRYIQSSLTDTSSPVGMNISDNKTAAAEIAQSMGLLLPPTVPYSDESSFSTFLNEHSLLVIKPTDGSHGNGVTTNVKEISQLKNAIELAKLASKSKNIILQKQITGHDVRLLIIDGSLAAAAIRTPASIKGDGKHTIAELIKIENANYLRGTDYHTSLNVISLKAANDYFGDEINSIIPDEEEIVQVVGTANIGTGGTASDVTDRIPVAVVDQAVKLLEELSLNCGGVDFITSNLEDATEYYFIEVNASPSFGLHLKPTLGSPRQVQKIFVDMLLRKENETGA